MTLMVLMLINGFLIIVVDIIYFKNVENQDTMTLNDLQIALIMSLLMEYRLTNIVGSFVLAMIFYKMSEKYQRILKSQPRKDITSLNESKS